MGNSQEPLNRSCRSLAGSFLFGPGTHQYEESNEDQPEVVEEPDGNHSQPEVAGQPSGHNRGLEIASVSSQNSTKHLSAIHGERREEVECPE
jgi:hypothetical protein